MTPTKEELIAAADSRFTREIHEKLLSARVAIAGLGGLGSNAAVMLARCNVGHMLLVDFDTVDIT
ncbi:MAG: ThiF family adenylyltransferase, partial [Clostridia bacterium]|nr:ThiF family adenylyltransferase [Clostridia bacterium]